MNMLRRYRVGVSYHVPTAKPAPHYLARIVGPSGSETFLHHGHEVGIDKATRYTRARDAQTAIDGYLRKPRGQIHTEVIDPDNPERGSVT